MSSHFYTVDVQKPGDVAVLTFSVLAPNAFSAECIAARRAEEDHGPAEYEAEARPCEDDTQ